MFERCSPATRYGRFLAPVAEFPTRHLADIVDPAPGQWSWIVDRDPGDVVGVASLFRTGLRTAEVGLLVEDAEQRHGFGTGLLDLMVATALDVGVTTLRGDHARVVAPRAAHARARRHVDGRHATAPSTRCRCPSLVRSGEAYAHPVSSALIGRRAELSWLRARVDVALGGFGHLVIVEGESGIGKTRLAQEALDHARRRRASVLRGRCYDHLDLPYLPLRDSLFVAIADAAASPADRDVLERVRADALEPSTTDAPEVIERERTRTLLALTNLVLGYARTTPTVVFVDDVDWADAATIDLLRHLMFRLDDEHVPLLVLATSRADPTARAAEGVARLRSEPRTAVVHLNPLTRLEATELARERQPGCPIDRARNLATASGGNPLLVEALVRDEGSSPGLLGAAPTHPMMAAVGATLDSLSRPAARVVLATAVLGPDAERAAVLTLSETSDAAIVEAIDAGVLVEDGTTLGFSHPIYAHTAYARASSATRRDQHVRAATVVHEERAIAHHLVAGGALIDDRRAQVRAVGGQRRAGPGRVGRGGPLLRGRAHPAAGTGGAGRAAPPGRAEPAGQPAAGPSRHPLRGRARTCSGPTPTPPPAPSCTSGASAAASAPGRCCRWWPTASRSRRWSTARGR